MLTSSVQVCSYILTRQSHCTVYMGVLLPAGDDLAPLLSLIDKHRCTLREAICPELHPVPAFDD